jgi:hypothetical protein
MSPRSLAGLMGVAQWFCLLRRGMLSLFSAVYAFCRMQPDKSPCVLPSEVRNELLLSACLASFLDADLTRPWHGTLCASDASQDYGFGLCSVNLGPARVRSLALEAMRSSCHVRLAGDEGIEVARLGSSYRLPLPQSAFRILLSKRAAYTAHSGALEATGVTLMMRWITRAASRHSHRFCCLVDARAVLGAASKGRSSAGTLRKEIARIGAICTAADILVRYVYIPSESNPADAPSRGLTLPQGPAKL